MVKVIRRVIGWFLPANRFPLVLLLVGIVSYGVLIPWLGFYWDDWHFIWISQKMGPAGLARYFATNRPYWGMIYQATTSLLGSIPWHYQVFGLFWRWASAAALWWLLRLVWARHASAAAWVSLFFLVYPGFDQQEIAITYGHFFLIYAVFLLSLALTVLALRKPQRFWLFTGLALLLSFINLLTMDYFFLLELLRPVFIWAALAVNNRWLARTPENRQALKRTLLTWLPYLGLFIAMIVWRLFIFGYQTHNYRPILIGDLLTKTLTTVLGLAGTILVDLFSTSLLAWGKALIPTQLAQIGSRTVMVYGGMVVIIAVLLAVYFIRQKREPNPEGAKGTSWAWPAVILGLLGLLVAGWPFWLTGLQVGLVYPVSRFTLPFMLGACLLLAGLLAALPLGERAKAIIASVLVALAVGFQFQVATFYKRDWTTQSNLFWQMSWRMPGLEPGTLVLSNDLPVKYFSDNSLTAPLNWIYAPKFNGSGDVPYAFYYPTVRLGTVLKGLVQGLPIHHDYLAASFNGNTSQAIAIYYNPPGCLRVLDPQLDVNNKMLPEMIRASAAISNTSVIIPVRGEGMARPESAIFGPEPAHGWCFYFEKAELARQIGDWKQIYTISNIAFGLNEYPNDPAERLVYIEGMAMTDHWDLAARYTAATSEVTPLLQPLVCGLWRRIDAKTPYTQAKQITINNVNNYMDCKIGG
jgi:hypothetical protein